jgi:hypothetical protein
MAKIRKPDGSIQLQNPEAEIVSKLALDLVTGYYAYVSAISIAMDKRADKLIPEVLPNQIVPVGFVKSKGDPLAHTFDFKFYLEQARENEFVINQLERVYLSGALLSIGDALIDHKYFNNFHSPIFQLIRHLRNGIAHGNKFDIRNPQELLDHPAHDSVPQNHNPTKFQVTRELNGTNVLFDFMEPGDILNVLHQVGFHLMDLACGVER